MSTDDKDFGFIDQALDKRKKGHRYRELHSYYPESEVIITHDDRTYINFCGNDYLGLSKHAKVIEKTKAFTEEYGAGSTASRLINGTFPIHEELEQKLADTFDSEDALLFNSGFQANSTILSTLADRHSLILADRLSHNSLLQGSLASRAQFRRFEHNSVVDLKDQLQRASDEDFERVFVVTESLFSMDGDKSDLEKISGLCSQYGAILYVDDAHAVGVYGESGLGLANGISDIDMVLGTCGKAFGSSGAFLLCSQKVKDYLINYCPGFIYTTAPPPAVVGSIMASLELIPELSDRRKALHSNAEKMRKEIRKAGFSTGESDSHIIPIIIGGEEETLALASHLEKNGILATAIRPPTVPEDSSRIRITLTSQHTENHLNMFLKKLGSWNG